jgi:hypothetical protein
MKLFCDACQRLLPPAAWTVEDGALRLTCAGCGATAVVEPAGGAGGTPEVRGFGTPGVTPREAVALTERVTPLVSEASTEGVILPDADAATGRVTPGVAAPDTPGGWLDAEWSALETRWDDAEAHRKLLARAEALGDLAALGRRYKARLDAAPADAAALHARDELLRRATARLLVAPPRAAPGGARIKNVVAATVLLTAVGLLVVLLVKLVHPGAP